MRGDGDGWVLSDTGARFWGRHGAAGLLVRAPLPTGAPAVLLQHRAPWSHQGGTWGLPGGAIDSHETAEQAAVREAREEAGLPVGEVLVRAAVVTATASGSHWTYTTVVADAPHPLETVPNMESAELRWVLEHEVAGLPLHPGFAASWDRLRTAVARVPNRPGLPRTVELESGEFVWCTPAEPGDESSQLSDRINALLLRALR
jgi:8-oxo-dGTP diphosphatase